jgi:hypothetical protein
MVCNFISNILKNTIIILKILEIKEGVGADGEEGERKEKQGAFLFCLCM